MDNPFEKRATEYTSDPRVLLPQVSSMPLNYFFNPEKTELFSKLTVWTGTPGCGKTTIARVLEFDSLWILSRSGNKINPDLTTFLTSIEAMKDGMPALLAHRIPMTTNFRSIWELPYDDALRESLLRAFVQSKAVLGWLRQLERAEIKLDNVEIIFRNDAESARTIMKADSIHGFREYARQVELSAFKVITALIPPKIESFNDEFLNSRYDIFEEIIGIKVTVLSDDRMNEIILKPMIMIDDAHELHKNQFVCLRNWLKSRVIRISRWIFCRPDIFTAEDYREALTRNTTENLMAAPGSTLGRDYYLKMMQPPPDRGNNTNRFRKVAIDIANRYFAALSEFAKPSVRSLEHTLLESILTIPGNSTKQLIKDIDKLYREWRFPARRIQALKERIPTDLPQDIQLGILRILLHREINNTPQLDLLAFEAEPELLDAPLEDLGKVRSSLINGANIQLMHEFERPYYFGMSKLADASNDNIEQFISLAGPLVADILTKITRRKAPEITPAAQHKALQKRANEIMNKWDFPYHGDVRKLVDYISRRCLERTLLPHAPLDDGANAFGIPQEEMDKAFKNSELLSRVLHFAFSYKALVLTPYYNCKNKRWCLLELGGIPILAKGLTLNRGGFIEGKAAELNNEISK